ncbi:signal peptidase I [Candidatus Microgenomates bacterium]|nr:signal peptidase I [Candidatus Microgenomates bacterium]
MMNFVKAIIDFVMDILETVTFVGSIFIVIYLFIMQPNQVKGASMVPTFHDGEYIFTSKVTYKFRGIARGDVVVFKSPRNPDIEYIKRVIGLPGDTVRVTAGTVYVNNRALDEPYTSDKTNLWEGGYIHEDETITVPQEQIWVMGDNRPRSSDSRDFGPVQVSSLIGQVFYRYFPPGRMGVIGNPFHYATKQAFLLHQSPEQTLALR